MEKERRSQKRYVIAGLRARVRKKTLFGLSSNPTTQEYPGLDISEGGIQFAISKGGFKTQDEILLDISIPSGRNKPICVKARVVWIKLLNDSNFGLAGLQFVSPSEEHQAELKALIQKHGSDKSQTTPYLLSKMQKNDSLLPRFRKQ
ncbi:MAG TPA: PilZ domain-containing protein [Planctomycetota bacterium]|nr:PilZ domain-containing protein [Planctomycetota bacterium]